MLETAFKAARDFLVALTGSWSANAVYQMCVDYGLKMRRKTALEAIQKTCGVGSRGCGFRVDKNGSELVPGTNLVGTGVGSQREKKESKKRENFNLSPKDLKVPKVLSLPDLPAEPEPPLKAKPRLKAPSLPPMPTFGALEPEVQAYLATAAAETKSGTITAPGELTRRREIAALIAELGEVRVGTGLRAANKAGAPNINYVKKAAAGSRARKPEPQIPLDLQPGKSTDYGSVIAKRTIETK